MAVLADSDISLRELAPELRREVRTFLTECVERGRFVPRSDSWMSRVDPAFSRELAERGYVGMTIPTEYGGHGRTALERFVVTEELLAAGAPVAAHWIADRQMAPGILRNGTEEQKRRYLPEIAAGRSYFSIGMSEPDSGSDLASVRTKAVETEGGWIITGTKVWTTAAHVATAMVALVRTDPSEGNRHAGLSQFIVDLPNPRIQVSPIYTIDGDHHFNQVVFDDAFVPADALLGERGAGWKQVTQELANERSGPERILSTAPLLLEWLRQADLAGDIGLKRDLGRLVTRLSALRQLSIGVAAAVERGESPDVEAALVKDLGTRFENEVVDVVRRYVREGDDELRRLVDETTVHTPAFTLRGGTNEILRSMVARGLGLR